MDISEETQKIGSNPIIRYGILLIGVAILFFSEGILTWKRTSAQDAAGEIAAINHKIDMLNKEIKDSDDSDEKKDLREEISDLEDNDLEEARIDAAGEAVDAKTGIWFWSMVNIMGSGVVALGLLIIAATGGKYEKIGALVALGLIVTQF